VLLVNRDPLALEHKLNWLVLVSCVAIDKDNTLLNNVINVACCSDNLSYESAEHWRGKEHVRRAGIKDRVRITNIEGSAIVQGVRSKTFPELSPEEIFEHRDLDHSIKTTIDSWTEGWANINDWVISVHTIHRERELSSFNLAIGNQRINV